METKEYRVEVYDNMKIWRKTDIGKTIVNEITLQDSESLPQISTIYDTILRVVYGRLSLKLNDQDDRVYSSGSIVNIPARSRMVLSNLVNEDSTVFLVRK
jgi:glyoxylate utilization-related uncharacterized protein